MRTDQIVLRKGRSFCINRMTESERITEFIKIVIIAIACPFALPLVIERKE